jgi:ABC-type lipoprotein export system ATPase subunit
LVVSGVSQGLMRGKAWTPLLNDVTFAVEDGEVVGIVGGRWSGKTTLLSIAAGIRKPERGSVRVGEYELTELSDRKRLDLRGSEIAWLNRAGMAQPLRVRSIIGWRLATHRRGRRETERRADQMLERVGAQECARQRWRDLSPWEQVLVAFAQAFAGSPRIVVIDDLLDALGSPATSEASDLLRSLIAEAATPCGVLMSASNNDSVMLTDRVWSLGQRGKLTPTTGHRNTNTHADILHFPARAQAEARGA